MCTQKKLPKLTNKEKVLHSNTCENKFTTLVSIYSIFFLFYIRVCCSQILSECDNDYSFFQFIHWVQSLIHNGLQYGDGFQTVMQHALLLDYTSKANGDVVNNSWRRLNDSQKLGLLRQKLKTSRRSNSSWAYISLNFCMYFPS